jgi:hypothetical protein
MATENESRKHTIVAANDFRVAGALHKAVDADGDFSAAGAATALGLAKSQPNSGQHLAVGYSGIMKAYAGAAISVGAKLTTAASGFIVTATSGSTGAIGTALEAANSGDLFSAAFDFANKGSIN